MKENSHTTKGLEARIQSNVTNKLKLPKKSLTYWMRKTALTYLAITTIGSSKPYQNFQDIEAENNNSALVVVDMQGRWENHTASPRSVKIGPGRTDYVTPPFHIPAKSEEMEKAEKFSKEYFKEKPNIKELIKSAQKYQIPIVFLEVGNKYNKSTVPDLKESLNSDEYTVLNRHSGNFSGFKGTKLDSLLKAQDIKTIVLAGLNTSACVLMTAISAHEKGYTVVISPQITMDTNQISLDGWDSKIATIIQDYTKIIPKYFKKEN